MALYDAEVIAETRIRVIKAQEPAQLVSEANRVIADLAPVVDCVLLDAQLSAAANGPVFELVLVFGVQAAVVDPNKIPRAEIVLNAVKAQEPAQVEARLTALLAAPFVSTNKVLIAGSAGGVYMGVLIGQSA